MSNSNKAFMVFKDSYISISLRQFIKELYRESSILDLSNLSVLSKSVNIVRPHWLATSFALNDNIASGCTSYVASAIRKAKYQRMLEMLPTLKILKIRHPALFSLTSLC